MKRNLSSLAVIAAGVVAPAAVAATAVAAPAHHPTHARTALDQRYLKLYHEAQQKLGTRAPGRDIVLDGLTPTEPATTAAIQHSIITLTGMIGATQPAAASSATSQSSTTATESSTATQGTASQTVSTQASGLTACIISRESGGDSQAVNSGGYMGLGQWAESTWLADGGGKYGATPLDASAAEQEQIIAQQVAAGNTGQWTAYDGC